MRRSRISAQTALLADLVSPRRTRLTRGSTSHGSPSQSPSDPVSHAPDLSRFSHASVSSSTRKRKREDGSTSASQPKTEVEINSTVGTRTSPRKAASNPPKKAKRQPAKKLVDQNGDVKFEPPANWEEMYNLTGKMRSLWTAPVDTMGCESLAEDTRSPRDQRFQTLVALMLSSQTKDTVTSAAIKNLQLHLPGGLNLEAVLDVDPAIFNGLIDKVGFHNNKTKFIKNAAVLLKQKWNSDIPNSIEGLVSLPGVGPKMAYLCMSAAWGRDEGIGVDVHVHRITNLWGWHKTQTPEQTRESLEAWLPREKWHDINHLLVGFGQTYCPPVGRRCDDCLLAQKRLCPSAVIGKKVKKEVVKRKVEVDAGNEEETKEAVDIKIEASSLNADGSIGDQVTMSIGSATGDMEDLGKPVKSHASGPQCALDPSLP